MCLSCAAFRFVFAASSGGADPLGAMPLLANLGTLAELLASNSLASAGPDDAGALQPPAKKRETDHFFHGVGISPVPGRLVQRIVDGAFVDMAELLPDNLELLRRESINPFPSKDSKVKLRQISSISIVLGAVFRDIRRNCFAVGARKGVGHASIHAPSSARGVSSRRDGLTHL